MYRFNLSSILYRYVVIGILGINGLPGAFELLIGVEALDESVDGCFGEDPGDPSGVL